MTRKSYKTVLRLKGIRPIRIERTVKSDGDIELLPVRGSIVHQAPVAMAHIWPINVRIMK